MSTPGRRQLPAYATRPAGYWGPLTPTTPFGHWIRAQRDRCRVCGYHPTAQGHHPDCPNHGTRKKKP